MSLRDLIIEEIKADPDADDYTIAQRVFEKRNPDQKYDGSDPSIQWVSRCRSKYEALKEPVEISVEELTKEEEIELEEEGEEEEEKSLEELFEEEIEELEIPEEAIKEKKKKKEKKEKFDKESVKWLVELPFNKLADATKWEGWRLTQEEAKKCGDITTKWMNKRAPELIAEYFIDFMLCWTLIWIVGQKAKGYKDYLKEKKPMVEQAEEETEKPAIVEQPIETDVEEPETVEESEELKVMGDKAYGEDEVKRRLQER